MTVKITQLNKRGHEALELSVEDAQNLIDAEEGRYFIIDEATGQIVHQCKVKEGQKIAMIPIIRGG